MLRQIYCKNNMGDFNKNVILLFVLKKYHSSWFMRSINCIETGTIYIRWYNILKYIY